MIALRASETPADYEAWLSVRRAVLPNESTSSLDELKETITQTGKENMQAVNARLGRVTTESTIAFGRSLPLR